MYSLRVTAVQYIGLPSLVVGENRPPPASAMICGSVEATCGGAVTTSVASTSEDFLRAALLARVPVSLACAAISPASLYGDRCTC